MYLSAFKISCLLLLLLQTSFDVENRAWREKRNKELRAEDGWLSVAGLFWLKEGSNSFGSGKGMSIVLPSAPERVGTLELANGVVTLRVADGVTVNVGTEAVRTHEMRFDGEKQPAPFVVGSLNLSVIKRGERYGLRVKDKNNQALLAFKGLEWFPASESYRVVATFIPDAQPKEMIIMNVLGDELKMKSPGVLSFQLNGRTHQLRPVMENDEKLFIIFRDRTAGKTSYGAGRFLYADLPKDGKVILDFNRAENPPCAFTPYATCPLPPRANFLSIAIPAGERAFHLKTKS
ncbi:MAG TPA: DUF1684 domain-containing protein [Pyrinomonadaceae bacterium]|nr:DUF1684 domain-containing protein [Pyrinomonadaceae bacterium]